MVGEILKKRREESGQDLREIAKTLKIRYDYLKAIEDENFEKLPVEVYIRGYIREYAKILNIDPEAAIKAYTQQVSPPLPEKKDIPTKETLKSKKIKIRYLLIPLLLLLTFAFILFPFTPLERMPHPLGWIKNFLTGFTVEEPKISERENLPVVQSEPPPPLSSNQHVLEVFAIDVTWLRVNIDGTIMSKEVLLKPGESVKWYAKNGFSLKIGNAGGVRLVFDRKEIGKLGEKGQVVRLNLP